MANKDDAATATATPETDESPSVETQAQEQTGQQQVRLRIDQSKMTTCYANAFRSGTTAEEIMLDFGLNQVIQARQSNPGDEAAGQQVAGEILFQVNDRIVLNYYTAKRLAITLGQLIRRYEDQFGELQLNVADRAKAKS